MKLVSFLTIFCAAVAQAFIIPLVDRDLLVRRQSVLDLKYFKTRSVIPEINFQVAQFKEFEKSKDTILFIPGLEFSSLSLAQYINSTEKDFNLLFLCSPNTDTPTFSDSVVHMTNYLEKENIKNLVIVGESSGALLGLGLGALYNETKGVILLNSATAYPNSPMSKVVDWGRNISICEYKLGILVFLLHQKCNFDVLNMDKVYLMLSMLINLFYFKKEMLIDRIDEWIVRAKEQVEAILPSYPTPVIVVASNKDEMFDSNTEAKRLSENIPKSQIVHVTGCGHLILEERFPLSVVINTFL